MANFMRTFPSVTAILTWTTLVLAYEPSPLQDFCVADFKSPGQLNQITKM